MNSSMPAAPIDNAAELEQKVAKVLRRFGYNTSEARQRSAEQVLRDLGPQVIPLLLKEFGIDNQRGFRVAQAFHVLGASASAAVPELEKLLPKDPDYVAHALVGIGLPAIQRGLLHREPLVCLRTAEALVEIAGREKLPEDFVEAVLPILLEQLRHPYGQVSGAAISALCTIAAKPEICIPALLPFLDDDHPRAAFALGKFGEAARFVIPRLIEKAENEHEQVRIGALGALRHYWISDERVVPILVQHLKDPDQLVRQEVVSGLGNDCERPDLAIPALIELMDVTAEMVQPLLLFQVKDTKHFASALYDQEKGQLDAIAVYVGKDAVTPQCVSGLARQVVYRAIPTILGRQGLEFQSDSADPSVAHVMPGS